MYENNNINTQGKLKNVSKTKISLPFFVKEGECGKQTWKSTKLNCELG